MTCWRPSKSEFGDHWFIRTEAKLHLKQFGDREPSVELRLKTEPKQRLDPLLTPLRQIARYDSSLCRKNWATFICEYSCLTVHHHHFHFKRWFKMLHHWDLSSTPPLFPFIDTGGRFKGDYHYYLQRPTISVGTESLPIDSAPFCCCGLETVVDFWGQERTTTAITGNA